jgi:hypothetical protein
MINYQKLMRSFKEKIRNGDIHVNNVPGGQEFVTPYGTATIPYETLSAIGEIFKRKN